VGKGRQKVEKRGGTGGSAFVQKEGEVERETDLVAVERKEELERIGVEDLDRRVEQTHRQQRTIRRVLNRQHIIRHLQRLDMREGKHLNGLRRPFNLRLSRDLPDFEVPELDVFVGGTGDEAAAVGADVERPEGTGVGGEGLEEGGGGEIVEEEVARFRSDHDLRKTRWVSTVDGNEKEKEEGDVHADLQARTSSKSHNRNPSSSRTSSS
jgi:hypothetical protein